MTNDNCLRNIACPKCKSDDHFYIVATITAYVTDDGADIANHTDMEWDDDSPIRCPDCGETGQLSRFRTEEARP